MAVAGRGRARVTPASEENRDVVGAMEIGLPGRRRDDMFGEAVSIAVFGDHEGQVAVDTHRRTLKSAYGFESAVYDREVSAGGLTCRVKVVVGFKPGKETK